MHMNNKGFTLVELMIVASLIGIFATMALPSYQDRIIRTQVKEALNLAEMAQDGVSEFYRNKGRLPSSNKEAGLPDGDKIIGNFTTAVEVKQGAINITLGNRINRHAKGKTISLRPALVKNEPKVPIAWVCGQSTVPNGMVAQAENQTDLEARLLPIECRY